MGAPKEMVSVVIPVFNGESYLREALVSITSQTYQDLEILVVDDGSTDRTPEIVRNFASVDSRIQWIPVERGGIVAALNYGLQKATGKYIARMDADDIAKPERFSRQVAYLESNPAIVALGTDAWMIDPKGRRLCRVSPPATHEEIVSKLLQGQGTALIHPTAIFPRWALEKIGGYRSEYRHVEDLDLYFRLSDIGELGNLDWAGLDYRQHLKSVNAQHAILQGNLKQRLLAERGIHMDQPKLPEQTIAEQYATWAYLAYRGGQSITGFLEACLFLLNSRCSLGVLKRFLWLTIRVRRDTSVD